MIEIIITAVATYGLSTLIADYDGAFNVFLKLRCFKVFRCAICSSVWIAAVLSFVTGIGFVGYLSVIGGVLILDRSLT